MLSFDRPLWFAAFLVFPVLLWARFLWRGRDGRIVFPYRIFGGDGFRPPKTLVRVVMFSTSLVYWLGAATLLIALAGPEMTEREEIYFSRGLDIMIVLDQSPSMGAQDFPPVNRFDAAKQMIQLFISGRSGDSIGLVTFGSDAVLRCPPTADYTWLSERINELELRALGDDTAIGMGLALATLHLRNSTAVEKIILLLTDGDDNAGEIRPDMAAKLASEQQIRVYSIGIGSEGTAPIELVDPKTGKVTRGVIMTDFSEHQLRAIAESTGGGYWRANSPGTLETVFQTIDALETVERRIAVSVVSRPLHRPLIIIGALMIILIYLIRKFLLEEIL